LRDYLGTFRASKWPTGEIVQGLLSFEEIERLLSRHVERRDSVVLRFPLTPDPPDSTAA
jgi:hypothetical protein